MSFLRITMRAERAVPGTADRTREEMAMTGERGVIREHPGRNQKLDHVVLDFLARERCRLGNAANQRTCVVPEITPALSGVRPLEHHREGRTAERGLVQRAGEPGRLHASRRCRSGCVTGSPAIQSPPRSLTMSASTSGTIHSPLATRPRDLSCRPPLSCLMPHSRVPSTTLHRVRRQTSTACVDANGYRRNVGFRQECDQS